MADFEQTLNSLLANPDAMGQIMALAGKLGADADEASSEAPGASSPPPPDPSPLFGPEQLSQMGRLLEIFQSNSQADEQTMALLTALRPFLREERQRKLDRAMRLAGLSKAARQAYRLWKDGELHL